MEPEIKRRKGLCRAAQTPDWNSVIARVQGVDESGREFLTAHPPGLVKALWNHYEATREACGCATPSHEKADCTVRLIDRLLSDEQAI